MTIDTKTLRSASKRNDVYKSAMQGLLAWAADRIDTQVAEIARLRVENDGLNAQLDRHTSYTIVHRGAALYCTSAMLDAYSDERARADAAEAEIARLREALGSIRQYGNDTLSGRADGGPDDRKWQREAVIEMRNRARAALQEKSNVPTV